MNKEKLFTIFLHCASGFMLAAYVCSIILAKYDVLGIIVAAFLVVALIVVLLVMHILDGF